MSEDGPIVLLFGAAHADFAARCAREADVRAVVLERRTLGVKFAMLMRRARKLGVSHVAGQLLQRTRAPRSSPTSAAGAPDFPSDCEVVRTSSLNTPAVCDALSRVKPTRVAVYGTSIIRQPLLGLLPPDAVNLHGGLTQFYRGQASSFWALHDGQPGRVGFTLHRIAAGIDTGEVVLAEALKPEAVASAKTLAAVNALVAEQGETALLAWLKGELNADPASDSAPVASATALQPPVGVHRSEPTWAEYKHMRRISGKR